MAPSTYYDTKTRALSARAQRNAVLRSIAPSLGGQLLRLQARKLWKAAIRDGHGGGATWWPG
jgi:putative transposase